ncbi:protein artichoke-like [Eriocheir sinensis]|uniref:protein artichoke-like n=1 Tax=Eriocheir sinensis TaxID=95602 RepID=UPI0021C85383|nr:protein artichoke-like [Eriocheir sinensis]
MERVLITSLLAAWAADGATQTGSGSCPRPEDNPWCSCYHFNDGVFLECSVVPLSRVAAVLVQLRHPVKSLNIYDLEANLTTFPPALFANSAGVTSLKISHSNLREVPENSFRGLQTSLHSLSIIHSHLTSIPQAALQRLPRLKTLDVEANNITELQSFSFLNIKLVNLNMKGNGLRIISEYAFDGLEESLEELNLINNKLKQLPIPALRRLSKLRILKAVSNHISDVISDGYSRLPALQVLDLSSNRFTQLTSTSLATMPALLSLSLCRNHIAQVAGDSFIQNSGLQRLCLSHNSIMSLAPETFSYTLALRVVDLSHNHLHAISRGLFSNLPELREVFLSNNNILRVQNSTFANSTKISFLYLHNNEIHSIESGSFDNLEALFDLQLSYNNLAEIPDGLFSGTRGLSTLSLDNNRITELAGATFSHLSKLKELRLQNNKLSRVEKDTFSSLPLLQELHLQDNMIQYVAKEAFSSMTKLQHLNLKGNKLAQVSDSLTRYPASLITLQYSKNQISTISTDALRGQNRLEILWLNDNNLTSMQEVLVHDLSLLQELYLQNNNLGYIQDKCFHNMRKLKLLKLSNNDLQHISSLLFDGLTSLEILLLDHNGIREIEPRIFQRLASLSHLDLSHNEILHVRRFMFEGSIPLRVLLMKNSAISEVDPYAFSSLRHLEELDLSYNTIDQLNRISFSVPSIRSLSLAGNVFQIIEENAFYDIPNLDWLDMSACGLFRLPPHLLAKAVHLTHLNIAKNNFTDLTSLFFHKLQNLREVIMSHNNLTNKVVNAVEGLTKLEVLVLNHNPIEELRQPLNDLPSLRELHLSATNLWRVDRHVLIRLKNLKTLDLSGNQLSDISRGMLAGSSVSHLNLAENLFPQIPNTIFQEGAPNLRVLNMSDNPMRRITDPLVAIGPPLTLEELEAARTNLTTLTTYDLQQMPNLRYLNLSRASINTISPTSLRNLTHLTHLNLAYNRLQILPKDRLRGLRSLVVLNLTGNILKKLEPLPSASHSLKVLDASGNKLTGLAQSSFKHSECLEVLLLGANWITTIHPRTFLPLTTLRRLDLSNNYLEELSIAPLEPLERRLEWLRLDGNPWRCGCRMGQLWTWLQDHLSMVPDLRELICHLPKGLSGQPFLMLSSAMLCPQPLILQLSVQDIQSQSLVLKWHPSNESSIQGYKVSFRETGEDGSVVGGLKTRSLTSTPTNYRLTGLRPRTNYLVCVHGLTTSANPTTFHHHHTTQYAPDLSSKCVRVRTHDPLPTKVELSNRLAIMIGVSLGIAIFFIAGTIICCRQMCKDRSEAAKAKLESNAGGQDYHTYRQFSVQDNNDASASAPKDGQTEC